MSTTKLVFFSLGSNLGDRLNHLQEAVFALHEQVGPVHAISKVYESPSWGFSGEDFLNACIGLTTTFSPDTILSTLLQIETTMGRIRNEEEGYQPRTIDLDILYYQEEIIQTDRLVIPHPNLHLRNFVLRPLADIAPQFYHPLLGKDTRNLLQESKDKSILKKTASQLFSTREALFSQLHFMSIEGNIGAGKTTLANLMAEDFNAKLVLERFADNPFLPKFYDDPGRYAFPLEMSFLADRYQQFIEDTSQFDLFKNFMISDYNIFKSLIFAKITLQPEEFNLYRKMFGFMYKETIKPKLFIYLYQSTERLLENIKKRGRAYEQHIKPEYLEKINQGYFNYMKSYPEQNSLVIDMSQLDFVESKKDYELVLNTIQKFAVGL